jgi:NADH dehydrogenase (ubiquinone) 1 alpha subcomplex subunit 8
MSRLSLEAQEILGLERDVEMYEEVDVTTYPLKAAAFFMGDHCAKQADAYMYCKEVIRHPHKCYKKSTEYTDCVKDLFSKIKSGCYVPFNKYWRCLEVNKGEYFFCRDEEVEINACMKEKFGIRKRLLQRTRPEEGYKPEGVAPEAHRPKWRKFVEENKQTYKEITPF